MYICHRLCLLAYIRNLCPIRQTIFMQIFPRQERHFTLLGSREKAVDKLRSRTEDSEKLISMLTQKSFIGIVEEKSFRLITSTPGVGALCTIYGRFEGNKLQVNIELNQAFKVLGGIMLSTPLLLIILPLILKDKTLDLNTLWVVPLQILFFRYVFFELTFRRVSKEGLRRLQDVLDIE